MTRRKNEAPPPADRAVADAAAARLLAQTPPLPWPGVKRPARAPLRRAIGWFHDTPRGAEAFLARYAQMPRPLRRALLAHYQTDDPWRGFREVCRLYGV